MARVHGSATGARAPASVTMPEREVLSLEPVADDPEVGHWLSAMADSRSDTLKELDGRVSDDMLEAVPDDDLNSIGTILYHVALVEADWVLVDVLGPDAAPEWPKDLLPYGDRDRDGRLTEVRRRDARGSRAAARGGPGHRARALRADVERGVPQVLRPREDFDLSAAWVLHHLLQHEAEHRAHIAWVRDRLLRG